MQKEVDKHYT